jgi:hypothetical protein
MVAYNIVAQVNDGVIYFLDRDSSESVEIATDDLAAHEMGSDTARSIEIGDVIDINLPT